MNAVIITLVTKIHEEKYNSSSLKIWKVIIKFEHCMYLNFVGKETFAAIKYLDCILLSLCLINCV